MSPDRRDVAWVRSTQQWCARDWWVLAGFVALSLGVVVQQWGTLIEDNHYVFWSEPLEGFRRSFEAWDPSRGLGRSYTDFTPVPHLIVAGPKALGLDPWMVQRVWYVVVLTAASMGMYVLMRRLDPQRRLSGVIAGFAYAYSAYSLGFLTPSWLYSHFVLTPWLVWAVLQGIDRQRTWRWAAVAALVVAIPGTLNLPAAMLAFSVVIPIIAVKLLTGETTVRRVFAFGWRSGLLLGLLSAPAFVKTQSGAGFLALNLEATETVADTARTSSWSESLRGLGGWILYWGPGEDLLRGDVAPLISNAPLVLATFVPPLVAMFVLARSTWRPRLLLGAAIAWSVTLMVGVYPVDDPTPAGSLLADGFDSSITLFGLRSLYKAGAGLQLGVAALVGFGVARLVDQARAAWAVPGRRTVLASRLAAIVAVGAALVAIASPMLAGGVLDRGWRSSDGLPDYHEAAITWLNGQPGNGRVLILPGSAEERFQWGAPSYDTFDPLLERPYILRTALQSATPHGSDLVAALYEAVYNGAPGSAFLEETLRRLGVEYVLVRNDVDWLPERTVRPAAIAWLAESPALSLAATFGQPGQNTTYADDPSPDVAAERLLPPVQIFRVNAPGGGALATSDAVVQLVSGGGDAWVELADLGRLSSDQAIAFTGWLSDAELIEMLRTGSPVLITDTNRRIQELHGAVRSATLTAEDDRRAIYDLYAREGSQTVVSFGDGVVVEEFPQLKGFSFDPSARPAAAFDRNAATAWTSGASTIALGHRLRVSFDDPTLVDEVELVPFIPDAPAARKLTSVIVRTSAEFEQRVRVVDEEGTSLESAAITVGEEVEWLEIIIAGTSGLDFSAVGFVEVRIDELDLAEVVEVPDELFLRAEASEAVHDALAEAPVSYLFTRLRHRGIDAEQSMQRRFTVGSPQTYDAALQVGLTDALTDDQLTRLLGAELVATSDDRNLDRVLAAAPWAVDGSPLTSWSAPAVDEPTIVVETEQGSLTVVSMLFGSNTGTAVPNAVEVTTGGWSQRYAFDSIEPCASAGCVTAELRIFRTIEPGPVSFTMLADDLAADADIVALGEIELGGLANRVSPSEVCVDDLVVIDGESIDVRLDADRSDVITAARFDASLCEALPLLPGVHTFGDQPGYVVESAHLEPVDRTGDSRVAADVGVVAKETISPEHLRFRLTGRADAIVTTGVSFSEGWTATTGDGTALEPLPVDGMLAYRVPGGTTVLDVKFDRGALGPAILAYLVGIVAVLSAIAWPRPDAALPNVVPAYRRLRVGAAAFGAITACYLIGDLAGALFCLAMLLIGRRQRVYTTAVLTASALLVALSAVSSAPPFGPDTVVLPTYADVRPVASSFAQMAVMCLVVGLALAIGEREPEERRIPSKASGAHTST